jgi:hypothetical protein
LQIHWLRSHKECAVFANSRQLLGSGVKRPVKDLKKSFSVNRIASGKGLSRNVGTREGWAT